MKLICSSVLEDSLPIVNGLYQLRCMLNFTLLIIFICREPVEGGGSVTSDPKGSRWGALPAWAKKRTFNCVHIYPVLIN